jgi:hypothetical protein
MRAFIQTNSSGEFYNVNGFVAYEGFSSFGYEIIKFDNVQNIKDKDPESIVVGGIGTVRQRLEQLGCPKQGGEIDYPPSLQAYMGRNLWTSTLQKLIADEQSWNIFIKPKDTTKKFAGKIISEYKDFIGLLDENKDTAIWCSDIVDFKTEWRCFIRYGEILDIRYYKGDWDSKLDLTIVRKAVHDFQNAPSAYSMDFGVDQNGNMKLIEINDGHSLGSYGISSFNYAKFLSARWAEMTGTRDHLS